MAFWNYPSKYPAQLDFPSSGWPGGGPQINNVDIVWAEHPNSLASAISTLQLKLGIDNNPAVGLGGCQFDPLGHSVDPSPSGVPCIWIDTDTDPAGVPTYTDINDVSYDLRNAANAAFIGYGYTCPLGTVAGQMVSISADDTVVLSDGTGELAADGIVISVYGGGTTCDIAYRAEVTGLAGLVAGTTYYLGDGGAFVVEGSIPVGTRIKQEVGVARNASTLVFNPTLATEV
jgi:hypothetical protein